MYRIVTQIRKGKPYCWLVANSSESVDVEWEYLHKKIIPLVPEDLAYGNGKWTFIQVQYYYSRCPFSSLITITSSILLYTPMVT